MVKGKKGIRGIRKMPKKTTKIKKEKTEGIKKRKIKNGWHIRPKKDKTTNKTRYYAIRYFGGIERERILLNQKEQTELGRFRDLTKTHKIILVKSDINKKYWKKFSSEIDYRGIDTKQDKYSEYYQKALDNYQDTNEYREKHPELAEKRKTRKYKQANEDIEFHTRYLKRYREELRNETNESKRNRLLNDIENLKRKINKLQTETIKYR